MIKRLYNRSREVYIGFTIKGWHKIPVDESWYNRRYRIHQ